MAGKYDKSYLDHLCDYEQGWQLLFTFSVGFLGLSLLWFVSLDTGSAAYVVTILNLFGLTVLALVSGFVLSRCR
ncbi:hypothetical protein [Natrinema soli]|uniref:Uncharacterized protein n=1 Tax=Natrinema soli TaxID=1930624 RepID=A0ABD5SFJ0_9EURY|nr:hypothetical protein [Natrinema soli]